MLTDTRAATKKKLRAAAGAQISLFSMPAKGNIFQDVEIKSSLTPSGVCLLSAVPTHQQQQQQQSNNNNALTTSPPGPSAPSVGAPVAIQQLQMQQQQQQQQLQTRRDVDILEQEIKENLKLGPMGFKAAAARRQKHHAHRSSPYAVPPSSRVGGVPGTMLTCDNNSSSSSNNSSRTSAERQSQLRKWNHQRRRYPSTCKSGADNSDSCTLDDPFQMLQELLTDGTLIKEAVRRLEYAAAAAAAAAAPRSAAAATSAIFGSSGGGGGGNNNKNRSFYDSDDECSSRTPPAYPDMLVEVGGGIM